MVSFGQPIKICHSQAAGASRAAAAIGPHQMSPRSNPHQRLSQARQSTISGLENGQLAAHICGNAKGPCWNANDRSYRTRRQQVTLGGGGGAGRGDRGGKEDDPAQSCRHSLKSTAADRSPNRGHTPRRGAESRTRPPTNPNALGTPTNSLNRSTNGRHARAARTRTSGAARVGKGLRSRAPSK
jgi:hypothetical protein